MVHFKREKRLSIYPCYPSDAIFPLWQTIAEEIVANINTTGIFTIGCFCIGEGKRRSRENCAPTVLVEVNPRLKRKWKKIGRAIAKVLDGHGLFDVGICFRANWFHIPDPEPRVHASSGDCCLDSNAGCGHAPGTLGWIDLKNPMSGEWEPLALTNAHCCLPFSQGLSDAETQIVTRWRQRGIRPGDTNTSRLLNIDSPGYQDLMQAINNRKDEIAWNKRHPTYRNVEEAEAAGRFVPPIDKSTWQLINDNVERLESEVDAMEASIEDDNHAIGKIYASSGISTGISIGDMGTEQLSLRDWALIQLAPWQSAGVNAIPGSSPGFKTALPYNDEKVRKISPVAGQTTGTYSRLKTCHIIPQPMAATAMIHWEHTVTLSCHGLPIVEASDLGSLIFDSDSMVVGILFAGSSNGDLAYFTSTQDLLEDIALVTGVSVEDIRLRGSA
ncbi:hypothetical protein BDV18DRAFT_161295 [Aspergillus unguis]